MEGAPDVAYSWTAPEDGRYTLSTEGSSFDTVLYLLDGGCAGAQLACQDDVSAGMVTWSQVSISARRGQVFTIVVDGFNAAAAGGYVLGISREGSVACTCEGRQCGSDGCGGQCGTCPTGSACDGAGRCVAPSGECTPGAVEACFSAPTGRRVGICHDGVRTCDASGHWSVCANEQTPSATEVCGNGLDDNCNGSVDEGCTSGSPTCGLANFTTRCPGGGGCPANGVCVPLDGGNYGCNCATGYHTESCGGGACTNCVAPNYWCVRDATTGGGGGTRSFRGRFMYEYYAPNATRTGWQRNGYVGGQNFYVQVLRGTTVLAHTVTASGGDADAGWFTVPVTTSPGSTDRVVVYAVSVGSDNVWRYAVGNPNLAPNTYNAGSGTPPDPRLWAWEFAVASLPADGVLRINECAGGEVPDAFGGCRSGWQGAGAARFFDFARYVYEVSVETYGANPRGGLLVWLQPGVTWNCGECQTRVPIRVFEQTFANQIFVAGGVQDREWWADSVTAHELGHWVMDVFSTPPNEGGSHSYGTLISPGLAWSEGFASWYSAWARRSSVFVDQQRGTMFWLDYASRGGTVSGMWTLPSPAAGLGQPMVENVLTSILWNLSPIVTGAEGAPFHAALTSPRMRSAPFARGYRNPDGYNVPVLPDFLDALNCAGFSRARIDAARLGYPYNTAAPLCR